jgi:hypothetical protein
LPRLVVEQPVKNSRVRLRPEGVVFALRNAATSDPSFSLGKFRRTRDGRIMRRILFERYNIVSECDLVEAAKKLNTLQPVPPASSRDGLASTKPRPVRHSAKRDGGSGDVGHNSGTAEPNRGPRLTVSL